MLVEGTDFMGEEERMNLALTMLNIQCEPYKMDTSKWRYSVEKPVMFL